MADDILVAPAGSGVSVATDEVSARHYQGVKLALGAEGAVTGYLAAGQQSKAASLPVVVASDQDTLGVNQVSNARSIQQTFTRPADTTAYAAGDVVGATAARITIPGVNKAAGGAIFITTALLEIDNNAAPASAFRLHLYSALPGSNLADNAAFDLVSGDRNSYLGWIDFAAPTLFGSTAVSIATNVNLQVATPAADIFAYLQTVAGYTPGNAVVYRITLRTVEG